MSTVPIVSILVPFYGLTKLLIEVGSYKVTRKGTTMETIGSYGPSSEGLEAR